MSTYKFYYFPGKGRGETTRMLFTLAGQKFEDIRLAGEKWQEFKPNTPLGQMPCLDVDGKIYCQSQAIERFVAKKFGFYGDNEIQQLKTDMILDTMTDFAMEIIKLMGVKDEEEKKKVRQEFVKEKGNAMLQKLDSLLGADDPNHAVGKKICWADVAIYNTLDFMKTMDYMEFDHSKLKNIPNICKQVEDNPKIKEWIANRPK